jgi:hypothetical protein
MSQKSDPRSTEATTPALSRRTLFAGAGAAGVAAVAASALPLRQAAAPVLETAAAAVEADGYQLTEHVKRYYQTARV